MPHHHLPLPAVLTVAWLWFIAGCSTSGTTEARLRSLAVEPELPAATTSADPRRHATGGVPEVIPPSRPFRIADFLASAEPSSRPATLAAVIHSRTFESAHLADGSVQLATAFEPNREPGPLPTHGEAAAVSAEPAPLIGEIRDMLAGYLRAFNSHDAAAVAGHWTSKGENLNLDSGEVTAGREAVHEVFADLFQVQSGAALDIDVTSIRPLRSDVALVDGLTTVSSADGAAVTSRFSAVVVREEGRWLLESVREAASATAEQPRRPLDELAWLVGFWEDVGEGVTAGTRCDWTPGKGFLLRNHVVSPDKAPAELPQSGDEQIPGLLPVGAVAKGELTELIGWDPDRREIRSWIFTADGRFAEGAWQREGDGWTVLVAGRGADAGSEVRCRLLPDGPDGLVVQCDGEGLEGLLPPACGFARTAR